MHARMLVTLAVFAAAVVSGCTVTNTPMAVPEFVKAEVLSYANPIVDSMLTAMNSGNYESFSADFSQAMKGKMDREAFGSMVLNLRAAVGKYVSRDGAAEVYEAGNYYTVTYTVQFTGDSPVSVILSFRKDSEQHLVEGISFTSKKLTGTI